MKSLSTHGPGPRVMHVITPSRMAGAETFLARLLRRTAKDSDRTSHSPTVHCVSSRGPVNCDLRGAGVELEVLGIGGKANLLAVPRLAAAARRFGADVLHSHLSTASWWSGWLEQFGGPPSIGHVHGFTSARWHSRQAHLIACSNAVKADLIAKRIPAERITVLHYPVDPDDVRAGRSSADVRAELGATDHTPIVGTFAHLSIKKGYRELVRAAEVVLRQSPTAQFWCFGEGPLRGELEAFARQAGIADRFRLLGFRRDVPDLMRAIDVMCLPSHREPFGLVYVEAALAGRPVIACNAGGAPEIIEHGTTGLLVPPTELHRNGRSPHAIGHNVEPIAEAILTLLGDRSLAARYGQLGREQAVDRFGWPAYLSRLSHLYATFRGVQATALPQPKLPAAATATAG